jgi:TonB family protein
MDFRLPLTALATGALPGASAAFAQRIENAAAVRVQGEELSRFRLLRGDPLAKHYPEAARREGIDGAVTVDVLINEAGQVLEAQVISETPRGHGFGLAALDAAKTFEFDNPLRRWVVFTLTLEFLP